MGIIEISRGALPGQPASENTAGLLPSVERVPLVPVRSRHYGPLVLKRRWRTFLIWLVVFAAAWSLLSLDVSTGWNAFALSIMFPGAGFVYGGGLLGAALAIVAILSIPAAVIVWFSCGNMVSVLAAFLGGAGLAALYAANSDRLAIGVAHWTPYAAMAFVAGWAVLDRINFHRGRRRAQGHNEVIEKLSEPLLREIPSQQVEAEMDEKQLAVARSFYEKGLQPPGQWEGFALDTERWQLRATRYQLYNSIATLACVNYQHTPAFHGYAREAMANLIYKNLDKRIWQFWFWENLWGNFNPSADPIRKDNIMVTGFLANYLGMYETLFGDRRFDADGALVWRWSDKHKYRYSHTGLVEALVQNYARYDFSWYPCEPNLLYSMCNVQGFNALQFYDKLRGTDHWARIHDRVEKSFEEEFMHPDGRVVCLLFDRVGLQAPMLSSALGESTTLPGMLALWPDKAERLWHVIKRQFLHKRADGSTEVKLIDLGWDRWDATAWGGNIPVVRRADEIRLLFVMLRAAVHMGDDPVVTILSDIADERYGAGTSAALKLGHRKAGFYRFITEGLPKAWAQGPILEKADFPDVLVARAVSDGQDLSLVLRPGNGLKQVALGLARLVPQRPYHVTGANDQKFVADAQGRANLLLGLDGRKELRIVPAS